MRSWLFVPGNRPDRIGKALASSADAVIIDWEDAVAGRDKPQAREQTRRALAHPPPRRPWLRINAQEDWLTEDLAALAGLPLAGLVLPKAESPEACAGVARTGMPLMALIETPLGVEQAFGLAQAAGVEWLGFGSLDYLAALQGEYSPGGEALIYPRSRLINAARAAGLAGVVDGAFVDIRDTEGLHAETEQARRLGFDGKLLVHPAQIEPVHAALAPVRADLDWARNVMAAWQASGDEGVITLDGCMIDAPLVAAARLILRKAGETP